jgi:hypothetical protein
LFVCHHHTDFAAIAAHRQIVQSEHGKPHHKVVTYLQKASVRPFIVTARYMITSNKILWLRFSHRENEHLDNLG